MTFAIGQGGNVHAIDNMGKDVSSSVKQQYVFIQSIATGV